MRLRVIKKAAACAAALMSVCAFSINAFSIIDFSVGESGLINNESTPYKVSIIADGKTAAVVPIGVGFRGDADGNGNVNLYDVIKIARYLIGTAGDDYEGSFGFAMADGNQDKKVDLYDAINVAKYLITSGTHEERWEKILDKKDKT